MTGFDFGSDFTLGMEEEILLVDGVTLLAEAGPESTVLDLSAGDGLARTVVGLWIGGAGASATRVQGFKISGAPVSGAFAIAAPFGAAVADEDFVRYERPSGPIQ